MKNPIVPTIEDIYIACKTQQQHFDADVDKVSPCIECDFVASIFTDLDGDIPVGCMLAKPPEKWNVDLITNIFNSMLARKSEGASMRAFLRRMSKELNLTHRRISKMYKTVKCNCGKCEGWQLIRKINVPKST